MATRVGKASAARRDWATEQERFLAKIAPENHFHRAFDGLGEGLPHVEPAAAAFVLRGLRLQPADLLDEVPDPLGK
ncbi:MAG: hypothetical protein WD072_12810 [Pirellulales bacterium]